jgi:hypothetical protein
MKKKRKGPPQDLTNNPLLKEWGDKARKDFRVAVDAIPVEDKQEIDALKKEEQQEEHFWKGYSNKLKEQVRSEDIFEEVKNFNQLKVKEKNNIFKKIMNILGF